MVENDKQPAQSTTPQSARVGATSARHRTPNQPRVPIQGSARQSGPIAGSARLKAPMEPSPTRLEHSPSRLNEGLKFLIFSTLMFDRKTQVYF